MKKLSDLLTQEFKDTYHYPSKLANRLIERERARRLATKVPMLPWQAKLFVSANFKPKTQEEANSFLKDQLFEIGKHKSFEVKYTSDVNGVKETKTVTLSSKNATDIFFAPIWNSASMKAKANCVFWAAQQAAEKMVGLNLDIIFIGAKNLFDNYGYLFQNIMYIDFNRDAMYVAQTIFHELTHYRQNLIAKNNVEMGKQQFTLLEFSNFYDSKTNLFNHNFLDAVLYQTNPREKEAELFGLEQVTALNQAWLKKFGNSPMQTWRYETYKKQTLAALEIANTLFHGEEDRIQRINLVYLNCQAVLAEKHAERMTIAHQMFDLLKDGKSTEKLEKQIAKNMRVVKENQMESKALRHIAKKIVAQQPLTQQEMDFEDLYTGFLDYDEDEIVVKEL